MRKIPFAVCLSFSSLFCSCKPQLDESNIYWGALKGGAGFEKESPLLNLVPGDLVRLKFEGNSPSADRGLLAKQFYMGLHRWGATIGRPVVWMENGNTPSNEERLRSILFVTAKNNEVPPLAYGTPKVDVAIQFPKRFSCQDFLGYPPIVAWVRMEQPGAFELALCPRFFGFPTEDESITLENYKATIEGTPESFRLQALKPPMEDPLLSRSPLELEVLRKNEKSRYPTMFLMNENMRQGVMYHELGHKFGLCDQYSTNNGLFNPRDFNKNCDSLRSLEAQKSIMNGQSADFPDEPLSDDLLGIRVLACLETKANESWLSQNTTWIDQSVQEEVERVKKVRPRTKFLSACQKTK